MRNMEYVSPEVTVSTPLYFEDILQVQSVRFATPNNIDNVGVEKGNWVEGSSMDAFWD